MEENINSLQQSLQVKEAEEGPNCYKKLNSTQNTKNENNPSGSSSGGLPDRENKHDNMLTISTPNSLSDRERYERSPGTAPSTYFTAGRLQCTETTVGK